MTHIKSKLKLNPKTKQYTDDDDNITETKQKECSCNCNYCEYCKDETDPIIYVLIGNSLFISSLVICSIFCVI